MAAPACLLAAGCGNSISPTNPPNTTAVTVTVASSATSCAKTDLVTLTSVVTNNSGSAFVAPTGAVTFLANGSTTLGTGTASPGSNNYSTVYTLLEPCSSLPGQAGAQNIVTATFAGDQFHAAGTSSTSVTITVSGSTSGISTTTSTPTAVPASLNAGQSTQLTATVTAASGTDSPTGLIAFIDNSNNGATVGTALLSAGTGGSCTSACATGSTSVTATQLGVGTHKIVAVYQPSNGSAFATSTSAAAVTVSVSSGGGGTTVSSTNLVASASSITVNQTTTLTATVSGGSSTTTPSGTVTFYDQTGNQILGTPVSVVAGTTAGTATATISPSGATLASGANTIIAEYSGDTKYAASSSASVTVTVTGGGNGGTGIATTTTSQPASASLAFGGSCVGLSIQVAAAASGTAQTPSGDVTVSADGFPLGSPNLGGYNGTSNTGWTLCADNGTPLGAAGSYSVLLSYPGDANYAASSVIVPVTVTGTAKAQVTADLSATSASTIPLGGCGSLQATLQIDAEPNSTPPSGPVLFYVNGTSTELGTAQAELSNGVTVANLNFCTTSTGVINAKGTYTINAVYGGDDNYNASGTSNGVTFVVD